MTKLKMAIAAFALVAFTALVAAQQGIFPNFPIVGGASYCSSTTNAACTNTVAAGPTALTGNETILASTNLTGGQQPQSVLVKPASLGALPITFVTVTTPPANISASTLSGGVVYNSTTTITSANITLPANPVDNQTYLISSNRTITTLSVTAAATETMGTNTTPTVLTASTTAPQGYKFIYNLTLDTWYRIQ